MSPIILSHCLYIVAWHIAQVSLSSLDLSFLSTDFSYVVFLHHLHNCLRPFIPVHAYLSPRIYPYIMTPPPLHPTHISKCSTLPLFDFTFNLVNWIVLWPLPIVTVHLVPSLGAGLDALHWRDARHMFVRATHQGQIIAVDCWTACGQRRPPFPILLNNMSRPLRIPCSALLWGGALHLSCLHNVDAVCVIISNVCQSPLPITNHYHCSATATRTDSVYWNTPMPESLVLTSFYREMENPPFKVHLRSKTRELPVTSKCLVIVGIQVTNPAGFLVGKFVVHKECCARVDGNRQTFSLHEPAPSDSLFMPISSLFLSDSNGTKVCFTILIYSITIFKFHFIPKEAASTRLEVEALPTVDIVRGLDIVGELVAAFRGKELVFAIDKVLYSYSFIIEILHYF